MDAANKDVLDNLIANLNILPHDAVVQIAKYVGGLKEEYDDIEIVDVSALCPLDQEAFLGIWTDRPDMDDSADTIRRLRQR